MIDVFEAYRGTAVQMTMQVHDELILSFRRTVWAKRPPALKN